MKRSILIAMLLIGMTMLTACGNKDDAAAQQAISGAQAEAAVPGTPPLTGGEVATQPETQGDPEEGTAPAAHAELVSVSADEALPIDLDLTKISGTVVYSQVYDMTMNPGAYMGQRIKMKGSFSYFQDPDTKQEYFSAIIADATACCAQGIEFVWMGEHTYPQDYPPLDTEITVTGTFNAYREYGYMYLQLTDAQVEWNS